MNFDSTHQEIVKYVVDIIYDLCEISISTEFKGSCVFFLSFWNVLLSYLLVSEITSSEDCYMSFYSKYLSSDMTNSFFKALCSADFDINNYGNCVSQMLQVRTN